MAYIPKEHEHFDILPRARKGGWEVFEYDSSLLWELREKGCNITVPYSSSYEEYYSEIDEYIRNYPELAEKLMEYKEALKIMNDKLTWGIVRYNGESKWPFTKGRYYYVPVFKYHGETVITGIIDDQEFTSYWFWSDDVASVTETDDGFIVNDDISFSVPEFEIIIDPDGVLADSKLF